MIGPDHPGDQIIIKKALLQNFMSHYKAVCSRSHGGRPVVRAWRLLAVAAFKSPGKARARRARGLVLRRVLLTALAGVLFLWALPQHAKAYDIGYTVPYTITGTLPHDPGAFTQGLVLKDGVFYESTGLYGQSSLRKVDPATGKTLARASLDPSLFGEGLAWWKGQLYQLTWKSGIVLLHDAKTLAQTGTLPLESDGWGATATPAGIVTSDGSDTLSWRDPLTFRPLRTVRVTDQGLPVRLLNALAWGDGVLFANVWHQDRIAVISPLSGQVIGWIDGSKLRALAGSPPGESDLNGLAWDPVKKRLYVTGKLWPKIFELSLERFSKS